MTLRELSSAIGMTLLTVAGLAVTAVLLLYAAFNLPWWCAWTAPAVWITGLVVLARLTWQEWRKVWRP